MNDIDAQLKDIDYRIENGCYFEVARNCGWVLDEILGKIYIAVRHKAKNIHLIELARIERKIGISENKHILERENGPLVRLFEYKEAKEVRRKKIDGEIIIEVSKQRTIIKLFENVLGVNFRYIERIDLYELLEIRNRSSHRISANKNIIAKNNIYIDDVKLFRSELEKIYRDFKLISTFNNELTQDGSSYNKARKKIIKDEDRGSDKTHLKNINKENNCVAENNKIITKYNWIDNGKDVAIIVISLIVFLLAIVVYIEKYAGSKSDYKTHNEIEYNSKNNIKPILKYSRERKCTDLGFPKDC